jgi:hypothetical protein
MSEIFKAIFMLIINAILISSCALGVLFLLATASLTVEKDKAKSKKAKLNMMN